ncbi:triphosphoribosyl-dephospho-CoA synthase [Candidatus Methylospira mobilis]|nr:triphosphoribosyl-dephospho-CoA synthase [Candidatus Methylospira mobilis]WNV06113.1 triphosphoribosyl-dephospho-CoA synthase [Candidatus Methylospira mobilis]
MSPMLPAQALETAFIESCECELQAFKPGNVSVYSEAHDMTVEDFRVSARVSAPFLADYRLSLGEKIVRAVRATRAAVRCNTNLGILLLAAPLMQACQIDGDSGNLRERLNRVLEETTVDDCAQVYEAIREAAPGGLGEVDAQDVQNTAPQITLYEAMKLAAERDRIAYQYTVSFKDIFDFAIPRYHSGTSRWGDEAWAAVFVFSGLLEKIPDTHIQRKFGNRFTGMVTERMTALNRMLSQSDRPEVAMQLLYEVDTEFKSSGVNPGTTADLTVACLLAVRLENLLCRCVGSLRRDSMDA